MGCASLQSQFHLMWQVEQADVSAWRQDTRDKGYGPLPRQVADQRRAAGAESVRSGEAITEPEPTESERADRRSGLRVDARLRRTFPRRCGRRPTSSARA